MADEKSVPLWSASAASRATGGALHGAQDWQANGLSIDTRDLSPGDLFIALKDQRDGHDFLADAFAKGAAAALVSDFEKVQDLGPALVVPDVLDAMRALARHARMRSSATRIAITGSVGKTSTKEAVAMALARQAPTHASVKSFNNHWGVPLTLGRMPAGAKFGVFEVGMNHRGEIAPLAELVRPHIAIVTWIAPAHVENLGSLERIADEKGDLFLGLTEDGAALIPADAPCADRLIASAGARRVVRFGREAGCEARLLRFDPDGEGANAEADILGRRISYRIGAPGVHWATNSLAALAAAVLAGGDLEAAAEGLAQMRAIGGRGGAVIIRARAGAFTVIDDSYNANPASMAAAFESLAGRTPGPGARRIAALGDMLELGPDEGAYHAGLGGPLQQFGIDLVFAAGPRMAALFEALPASMRGGYASDADSLSPLLAGAVRAGDIVLVKGSNGSRMIKVIEALRRLEDA
jgi:UDP-N-acetylmuramoyl-tripeptide--D-alanyl-D-alanine ligase